MQCSGSLKTRLSASFLGPPWLSPYYQPAHSSVQIFRPSSKCIHFDVLLLHFISQVPLLQVLPQWSVLQGLLFALLFPVSNPWATHCQCDDLLGLVVDGVSINCISFHFLMFGIKRKITVRLHHFTFVPWLGSCWGILEWRRLDQFQSCKISKKSTLRTESWPNRYLFWADAFWR